MFTSIMDILAGILKAIPILDKWFHKATEKKVEEVAVSVREEVDQFHKTGRPK